MKPVQLSIFDQPTLNISADLTRAMHEAVKNSDMSREQIVDRMNDLADRYGVRMVNGNTTKLTMTTFEKWINPDDPSRQIPVRALPIFCAAVGRPDICDIILQSPGDDWRTEKDDCGYD